VRPNHSSTGSDHSSRSSEAKLFGIEFSDLHVSKEDSVKPRCDQLDSQLFEAKYFADEYSVLVRDVRTAWLAANTAFQRVSVTAELLQQANLALTLAQTRYQLGLSSIVELSQAQFQQTDAAIGNANAQYQYRLTLATLNYQTGATP
jgi:hypothetical protein